MGINYTPKIVTNGLVFCVDAANPLSYPGAGTTWNDLLGSGKNGTLTNGATFNSPNRGSIALDGTNDYIDFGKTNTSIQFGTTSSFTISVWFKLNTLDQNATLVSHGNSAYNMYYNGGGLNIIVFAQARIANDVASPLNTIDDTNWKFATVINNVGVNTIHYINSQHIRTTAFTNGDSSSPYVYNNNFTIGYSDDEILPLNGNVSFVLIHNRALSATEILQNYNATKGRFNP